MATKDKQKLSENSKRYYRKNKWKYAEYRDQRRKELREVVEEYKQQHPCACGEDNLACLVFHHRNANEKELEIAVAVNRQWSNKRLFAEIEKCEVMCANCHLKLHKRNQTLPTKQPRPSEETLAKIRKFNPTRQELERLVREMPMTKVAAKFDVSDNAIRKRCRLLGIEW
jgi:hypothetical protein